jgi:RNA polymerase sigma-70 factor (ECF subfamily)
MMKRRHPDRGRHRLGDIVEMSDSEVRLTGEAGIGETLDFNALVDACQDKLYNVVLRMVGNAEDALDIVQEAFLKAYRSLSRFKGQSGIYTWLYRIAVNTALSFRRSAPVQMSRASVSLDENPHGEDSDSKREVPDSTYNGSAGAERGEAKEHITRAILELEPELRTVVVLRDLEDLSYEEIAQILEVPKGTVKSRLHRGRLVLRDKLKGFV